MTAHDATSTEWSRARCSASTSKCLRTPCSTPDAEEDARVLEAALAGHAEFLVTYNIEDFLPACTAHPVTGHPHCLGVQVIKPADLAGLLDWPLRVVPRPTLMPPPPPKSGGRDPE
jgi:hypothetical protein